MTRSGPRIARYTLAGVVLLWVALSELGVLVFAYGVLQAIVPGLPSLSVESVAQLITSPAFLIAGGVVCVTTAAVGRQRYGSLATFTVAVAKRADSVLGWTLFDEPLLVGRIEHDDVAWRLEYLEGGHVKTIRRECLFCGLKLVEGVLPREVVHGPNTGFEPGEENRETAAETWADVFGREKAEDHGETLALTCPRCNFSVPGQAEVLAGQDGARAKFRQHVDRMRTGNRRGDPFAEYAAAARAQTDGEPSPLDIWDAYVQSTEATDALRINPGGASDNQAVGDGRAGEIASGHTEETGVSS